MGFLKKIRSNLLNQQNSFHIGFGNRSPFSYTNQYGGDWTPEVPAIETPETDLGEMDLLDAQIETIGKVRDTIIDTAKTFIKVKDKKNCEASGGTWKDGSCSVEVTRSSVIKSRADRVGDRSGDAYAKNTKRGDKRGKRLYDKEEDLLDKSVKAKAKEDCTAKGGTWKDGKCSQ